MSKSFWGYAGAAVAAYFGLWQIAASLLAQGVGAERQRKARNQARDAYNAGLQDRMVMGDLQPDAPRTLVLGRVRAVEGVRRRWASGTHSENLTLIVSFAGHEIDAFETFWFNDLPLRLDGDGYVETPAQLTGCSVVRSGTTAILTKTAHGIADGERVLIAGFSLPEFNGTFTVFNSTANTFSYAIANAGSGDPPGTPGTVDVLTPYTKTENVTEYLTGTLDGAGEATVTLTSSPLGGTVAAMWSTGTGESSEQGTVTVTQDTGLVYDLTAGRPGAGYQVSWQTVQVTPMARIRTYLGTDAQSVGTDLAAEYPGHLTATDDFAGIALAVIDLTYSEDAYPQGIPNITATMRGAKCFDPRDDSTAWTENPSLHALHYATWDHGWRVPIGEIREQDVIDAADECDISTTFTLGADDYTLERYRCGIVISSAADPRQSMGDIMETMAGRWGWAGGTLRMRCGRMATPAWAIDQSWVAQQVGQGGQVAAGAVVKITNGVPREDKVNHVSGTCIDPAQRYQALPYPAVRDDVLIAADGAEYRLEAVLPGVNHIAHAQHLASITIREGQAPLRMEVSSNLSAYPLELFDVGTVTLPRYGMSAKTMEVTGWRWRPTEGVQLRLAEITEAMFEPVDSLNGRDPAPNGNLQSPWYVAPVTGVDVDSEAEIQPDGAVLTLTVVTWDAIVSQAVLNGGRVEVQYTRANAIPATGDWPSWIEQGGATSATIPGLKAQAFYLFRVRAINALGVRGPWSAQVLHQVLGDLGPPEDVTGFAYVAKLGQVVFSWDPCEANDYAVTEIRVGASWAAGVFGWAGKASDYKLARPDNGTYLLWAKHKDTSGNYSTNAVSLSVTVDDSIDGGGGGALVLTVEPAPIFTFADGTTHTSASPDLTFTAHLVGLYGTASFTAEAFNALSGGTSLGAVTLSGTGNARTLSAAQFVAAGTSGSVKRVDVTATLGGAFDTSSAFRYDPTVSGPFLYLDNPVHPVQTDESGEVGNYTGAFTHAALILAGADDTANWSFSITPDSGVTATINGGAGPVTGEAIITIAVSDMTIDDGVVLVTATKSGETTQTADFRIIKRPAQGVERLLYFTPRTDIVLPVDAAGIVTSFVNAWTDAKVRLKSGVDATDQYTFSKVDENVTSDLVDGRITITAWVPLGTFGSTVSVTPGVGATGWERPAPVVIFGDGVWVQPGLHTNPSAPFSVARRSTDYETWDDVALGVAEHWSLGSYTDGAFVLANNSNSNQVLRSDDGGLTFSAVTLPITNAFQHVRGQAGTFILLPNGHTTGLRSTDGGASWSSITVPSGPFDLWGVGINRWLFKNSSTGYSISTDNGTSWSSVSPAAALKSAIGFKGIIVAAYSGASTSVTYSEDSGATWADALLPASVTDGKLLNLNGVLYLYGSSLVHYSLDGKRWQGSGATVTNSDCWCVSADEMVTDIFPLLNNLSGIWAKMPLLATAATEGAVHVTASTPGEEDLTATLPVQLGAVTTPTQVANINPAVAMVPSTADGVVTDFTNASFAVTVVEASLTVTSDYAWTWTATHLTPSSGSGSTATFTDMDDAYDSGRVSFVGVQAGKDPVRLAADVVKLKGTDDSGIVIGAAYTVSSVTNTYVEIRLTSAGVVQKREGSGGSWERIGQWAAPEGASAGSGAWVRFDVLNTPDGTSTVTGTTGTFQALTSDRGISLSDTSTGTHKVELVVYLSPNSGGTLPRASLVTLLLIVP